MSKHKQLLLSTILIFFLLGLIFTNKSSVSAEPSNNPIFATIQVAQQMISEAISPIQNLLNNHEERIQNLENNNFEGRFESLENKVSELEERVADLEATPTPTPTPTSTPGPIILFSDNFDSGNIDNWEILGGNWQVSSGQLIGSGDAIPLPIALIRNLTISDYIVELDMTSITRVDKLVFVRFKDVDNFIVLNFRAARPLTQTDVVIEESVNGNSTRFTPEFSVPIPTHQLGEPIHVRIEGKGNSIRIWVNYIPVLNSSYAFTTTQGKFGLGVFNSNTNSFDNIVISTNP